MAGAEQGDKQDQVTGEGGQGVCQRVTAGPGGEPWQVLYADSWV